MHYLKSGCNIIVWIREEIKLKKLFLIFTFLIAFIFTNTAAFAAGNYLHTITLENTDSGYNIILGTDKLAKVSKKTPSENELVMELSGIVSAETVNAIYKGSNNIDGFVVENAGANKLRIHITAPNIKNSTIMIEPINGVPTIVGDSFPIDKVLWIMFGLALVAVVCKISKDITDEDDKPLIRKDIKEREIEMYKKYRSELASNPISMSEDFRMKRIMKKIDRKIDERLTSFR